MLALPPVKTDWNNDSVGAFITTKPHLDRCVRYLRFGNGVRLTKAGEKVTRYSPCLDITTDPLEERFPYDPNETYFAVHCAFGCTIPAHVEQFLIPQYAVEYRSGLRVRSPACHSLKEQSKTVQDADENQQQSSSGSSFRFIELFAGIGMFRVACEKAGGRCVFASEIATPAREVYGLNFKETPSGDITELPADAIPDHDLLTAGFPCQSFSTAGDQQGLSDSRGKLFFEVCRVLSLKQPRLFLLENVANLLVMEDGSVFQTVRTSLELCGYLVSSRVIDAAAVVPQRRRRVYLIGSRKDIPQATDHDLLWTQIEHNVLATPRLFPTVRDLLDSTPSEALRLTSTQWANVTRLRSRREDYAIDLDGVSHTLMGSYRVSYPKFSQLVPFPLTAAASSSGQPVEWRFLSPVECAKLQGIPECFCMHPHTPSFTENAQYKLIGNSVCPMIVFVIVKQMMSFLT